MESITTNEWLAAVIASESNIPTKEQMDAYRKEGYKDIVEVAKALGVCPDNARKKMQKAEQFGTVQSILIGFKSPSANRTHYKKFYKTCKPTKANKKRSS